MNKPIDIKIYLPHRAPMLMVDWILSMDNEHVETVFDIKPGNIFIQNGLFVEAGLIENAAQTCSAIVGKGYFVDENNEDREDVDVVGFISALKTLKIHSLVKEGDTINTKAVLLSTFVGENYSLCTMGFRIFTGENLISEGEINLFIQANLKVTADEKRGSTTA